MQLRSIQTGPAIELPLTNSPQTLPFEWRAHIPSKRVFLEVLLEGFPPLKLVAGDPAGLSAKPERALWKHSAADYVSLAISWQTQGQQTSVAVDPRYMLASLKNKWVPLFSKTSLVKRYEDSKNMHEKMTQELDNRKLAMAKLQQQRSQAESIPVSREGGGISGERLAFKKKQIALAKAKISNNEEAIDNLDKNLIPAIDADLKRFPTLQKFADACEHNARVGFRLYCKAEDHKLVLYEALPTQTAKGKPAGRKTFGTTLKAAPSPPPNLNKGLVAWYPFNGNAKDESGNQNDGKVKGAILSQNRHGNPNLAYRFDGKDDYISAPHQPYLNFPSGNLTISMWSTIQNRNAPIHFIGKDTGGGTRPKWIFIFRGGHLSFHVVPPNNAWYASTNFRLPQVGWHHYLVTKNGSRYTIYVDGMSVSQSDGVPDLPTNNSAPLTIGQAEGGGWVNGSIDDVRIYNRALSATEVKSLYDHEK
jgi:hypothetical protein